MERERELWRELLRDRDPDDRGCRRTARATQGRTRLLDAAIDVVSATRTFLAVVEELLEQHRTPSVSRADARPSTSGSPVRRRTELIAVEEPRVDVEPRRQR